jgi:transcriptional regulator with XRE-family HTH domain
MKRAAKNRGMAPPILPEGFKPQAQGRRLRALIKQMKWKQKELAIRTGISAATISKICNGHKPMDSNHAYLIAMVTGVTTEYLLYGIVRNMPLDIVRSLAADD